MASNTKRIKVRRAIRRRVLGAARKRALRTDGSTQPNLPLNKPNANEQAQASAK